MSVDTLRQACARALDNPSFQPANGETFCNLAVTSVAEAMGCEEFSGLMADQIYAKMEANASGKWEKVVGPVASQDASEGNFVVAAMSSTQLGETHGHVATCYPQAAGFSGSLNKYVPVVANIGKSVGVMKSSEAFPVDKGEPDYFSYQTQEE